MKRTFQPNNRKKAKTSGFLARKGTNVLKSRRAKGRKVVGYDGEKAIIDIRNRLQVGDTLEILVPNQLEAVQFKIDKLWDFETDEEMDVVNPGVKDQKVKMMLPIKCEENWIIRRKK